MAVTGSNDIGNGSVAATVSHDPTAVATDAKKGSILVEESTAKVFRKLDSGSTTNVAEMIDTILFGNFLVVDAVNGNDSTGVRGKLTRPFLTISAALAAALSGDVVFIQAGTYNLSAGILIPAGVTLHGVNSNAVTIQMLGVSANTTLVTMSVNTRIQNVTMKLTSAGHFTLTGVLFPGTTSASAKVRDCVLTVDNSGAGAGTSNVTGVLVQSTGTPDRTVNALRAFNIKVFSAGSGNKRGILMDTSVGNFSVRDTNIIVTGSSGTGVEINIAGGLLTYFDGIVTSPSFNIAGTAGTLEIGSVALIENTISGSFTQIVFANVIRETGGPTILTMGSMPDGQFLKRSGTQLVGAGGGQMIQSLFVEQTTDTTLASTTFTDLLTINITTGATFIVIEASVSSSNTNASRTNQFRIMIDGVAKRAAAHTIGGAGNWGSSAIIFKQAVTAGAHTVKLQWAEDSTSGGATVQIRPVAAAGQEHASLHVIETGT